MTYKNNSEITQLRWQIVTTSTGKKTAVFKTLKLVIIFLQKYQFY